MSKTISIIGVGNCGCQVANLASKKYSELFDAVFINTSSSDLSMVEADGIKIKIGDQDEIDGSGKNRTKMKQYLKDSIKKILTDIEFINSIAEKKYAFIVSSAAGGTGSGATPVLLDVLRHAIPDTKFILVTVLPTIKSSLMEQGNTLEMLNELYDNLGSETTYMIYDNETASDKSPTEALSYINENIVEDIRVLSSVDNFATPYESIDAADMESIIGTPGRLLVARVSKNLTEKNMEDSNLDDVIVKTIKKSAHAETDRNKKVVRWGLITYFTENVNKLYNSELEGLINFIGTPIERFNHNAINPGKESENFLYLIASGLSPVNDRVAKVVDRIAELKAALATDDSSKYILSGDNMSYDVLEARKKEEKRANATAFNPDDIFSKFM